MDIGLWVSLTLMSLCGFGIRTMVWPHKMFLEVLLPVQFVWEEFKKE
jgi:hypothetical protein